MLPDIEQLNQLLLEAAKTNNLIGIKQALAEKVNVNAQDEDGNTPLMWAAHHGDKGSIKTLLDAGANMDMQNKVGNTALIRLAGHAYNQYTDAAVVLLDAGANPHIKNGQGDDALFWAERKGFTEIATAVKNAITRWESDLAVPTSTTHRASTQEVKYPQDKSPARNG